MYFYPSWNPDERAYCKEKSTDMDFYADVSSYVWDEAGCSYEIQM